MRLRRPFAARSLAAALALVALAGTARAEPIKFAFKVPSLDGGTLTNDDYKGKIVVVDVWATWCGPCRMVIPHLVKLQEKFKDKGVVVVGLDSDEGATGGAVHEKVRNFVRQHGINYPIGLMNAAAYIEVAKVMGFNPEEGFSIPTTMVLGRNGRVVKRYPGYFDGEELEIEKVVSDILAAETGSTKK